MQHRDEDARHRRDQHCRRQLQRREDELERGRHVSAQLERHAPKGLFLWSRVQGLWQTGGPEDRVLPGLEDPMSILEHIAQADRGLYLHVQEANTAARGFRPRIVGVLPLPWGFLITDEGTVRVQKCCANAVQSAHTPLGQGVP